MNRDYVEFRSDLLRAKGRIAVPNSTSSAMILVSFTTQPMDNSLKVGYRPCAAFKAALSSVLRDWIGEDFFEPGKTRERGHSPPSERTGGIVQPGGSSLPFSNAKWLSSSDARRQQ